ncbi:hypothetical protein CBS101457_005900 [Exobasidium rhododendri]|nr:hypothetical protein CBS101457_005900 [Exobasidium rhododendri]
MPSRKASKVNAPTLKEQATIAPEVDMKSEDIEIKTETPQVMAEVGGDKADPTSLASPPAQDDAQTTAAQPRRSMTRTRKPSSRLLPSPSPPPTRTSHYHHYQVKASTSPAQGAVASAAAGNGGSIKNMQKKQHTVKLVSTSTQSAPAVSESTSTSTLSVPSTSQDKEVFGPGKRKRRPSTMSKPPSTITSTAVVPATSTLQSQGTAPASSTGSGLKIRISRVASKSQSPEEKALATSEKTSRKAKAEDGGIQSTPVTVLRLSSRAEDQKGVAGGYESDGNAENALLMAMAEPDGDGDHDEDSDAGATGSRLKKLVGGVRSKGFHALSAAREKFGVRRWPTSNGCLLEPPPLLSRRGGLKSHQGVSHSVQRSTKQSSGESSHARSQSASILDGRWAWTSNGIAPTLRFRLGAIAAERGGEEEHSEASDLDEEDDFHVAMLDGGDFGEAQHQHHHQKSASLCSKSSRRDSKSGDDSETEDTPATTPRSPQSTCDLPERRSSAGLDEDEKDSGKKDAVFAHALETSSRRPHTHAGSLTLSLPFDEMIQANEEDGQQHRLESTSRSGVDRIVIKEEEEDGEDERMAVNLLSPVVHPSILGLSTKQHALMLSSPHASSAFTSPSFEPSAQGVKPEVLPLTLPPPAIQTKLKQLQTTTLGGGDQPKQALLPSSASIAGRLVSSGEDEEDKDEHAALVMEPPERMCLSELDLAWEQSESLTKPKRAFGIGEEETEDEKEREEEIDEGQDLEKPRKRGGKRVCLEDAQVEEAVADKKAKTSSPPKHKSPARLVGRRSARQSTLKT